MTPERALVIVAHPDDAEFQAGGTVAVLCGQGVEVVYCVITDGEQGGADRSITRAEMARVRRAEQVAAAAVLGVSDVRFLGYRDGELAVTKDLTCALTRVIRQVRPDLLLIQSPEYNLAWLPDTHPDHRAAGEAALTAAYPDARNPFAHPELESVEGLTPWAVPEIWVMTGPHPDHYVDVAAVAGRKVSALRAHVSQTGHLSDLEERVHGKLSRFAARAGWEPGRLAEAFQRVLAP